MSHLSDKPIVPSKYIENMHHPKAGAIVLFSGESRNHNEGKAVKYLEYEAHESLANKIIDEIIESAKKKWELHDVFCMHRTGKVDICESAVVIITLSSHRDEAYAANRYIIDRLKHEAPIWKKEYFEDGSIEWSKGCEHEHKESVDA
ncbi:MAG: molybdenum cofactor biosynthesis protein MoaE [Spirochaetia bacterium]|nr:molybdenum cofactor biosynthesis protein MoaE [Spirochaetia bacterium]